MHGGFTMSRSLPRSRRSPRLAVERLEQRATPDAKLDHDITVLLQNGTLLIQGSDKSDNITVQQDEDGRFHFNGSGEKYAAADIRRIEIHGNGGDDKIKLIANHIGPNQKLSALLDGGDGDDRITGSKNGETIAGGAGKDVRDGEAGNDTLDGGDGDDTLLGSDGADNLSGGNGSDELWGEDGTDFLRGGAGDDLFRGGTGRDTYKDDFDLQRPVVSGFSPQDVQQGSGGTCTILSVLAGAAATGGGTTLADRITYQGNNTYDVKLYTTWLWGLFTTSETEKVYFDGTW